jgi:hypothetical protein
MIFVSAVFTGYPPDHPDRHDYTQKLLGWLRILTSVVPVHVVCEPSLELAVREIPGTIAIPCVLEDLPVYKAVQSATDLPPVRNMAKDTHSYMRIINGKPEYIRKVRDAGYVSDRYVWIDAGVAKLLSDPVPLLHAMVERCKQLPLDKIVLPGCWDEPAGAMLDQVCWRFCCTMAFVPARHVDIFADMCLHACSYFASKYNLAIWEGNIWASVEHLLPILWTAGDHNDRLFDLKTDRPISNEETVSDGSSVFSL